MQQQQTVQAPEEKARAATRMLLHAWGHTLATVRRWEDRRRGYTVLLNNLHDTLKAMQYSDMPKGKKIHDLSDVVAANEKLSAEYRETIKAINDEITKALRLERAMNSIIQALPPVQREIICYRYADGHRWNYIASRLAYNVNHLQRVEKTAIDRIREMLERDQDQAIAHLMQIEDEAVDEIAKKIEVEVE